MLTFATDGRQTLQGTLAAEELDLTPYVSTVRLLTNNERDWNRVPLAIDGLTGLDLDLRLSAARDHPRRAPSSAAPPSPPTCAAASSS